MSTAMVYVIVVNAQLKSIILTLTFFFMNNMTVMTVSKQSAPHIKQMPQLVIQMMYFQELLVWPWCW